MKIRTTISDSEIAERTTYWNDKKEELKPFIQCKYTDCCNNGCDYKLRAEAEEYARRIFNESFNEQSTNKELLIKVYKDIPEKLKNMVGNRATKQMVCCTRIQFLRKIIYNTKIPFSIKAANKTISAGYQKENKK